MPDADRIGDDDRLTVGHDVAARLVPDLEATATELANPDVGMGSPVGDDPGHRPAARWADERDPEA